MSKEHYRQRSANLKPRSGYNVRQSVRGGAMTEEEWLTSTDLWKLMRAVQDQSSNRKNRLLAVAFCRRLERILDAVPTHQQETYRQAVAVSERYADGTASDNELDRAFWNTEQQYIGWSWQSRDPYHLVALADGRNEEDDLDNMLVVAHDLWFATKCTWLEVQPPFSGEHERRVLFYLFHDIFGNPFRPVTFAPEWRTDTAIALAQQMYDSRDFSAMPILADALQDAGCDNDDILSHCRDTSLTHVRGCWVVDLVLGKK
jgi:hypothetical protein